MIPYNAAPMAIAIDNAALNMATALPNDLSSFFAFIGSVLSFPLHLSQSRRHSMILSLEVEA